MHSQWLADLVAVFHSGFVAFIVTGFIVAVAGDLLGWRWTSNLWFRGIHLAAIGFVAARTWLTIPCPLTVLEAQLSPPSHGDLKRSPLARILHRFSFNGMNDSEFKIIVTVFAIVVLLEFVWMLARKGVRMRA